MGVVRVLDLDPTVKSILFTVVAYMFGSIPVGLIVCHIWAGIDIRDFGSGNIGMTNVFRTLRPTHGNLPWVMTLVLDFAKGYLPVYLALIWLGKVPGEGEVMVPQFYSTYVALVVLAVMLGNLYPIYIAFRGGKGIATGLGVFSALMGFYVLIPLGIFLVFTFISRMVSVGSIAAIIAMPLTLYFMGRQEWGLFNPERIHTTTPGIFVGLAVAICLVALFKHRANIRRIMNRTEPRLSFAKAGPPAKEDEQPQSSGDAEVNHDAE